MVIWLSVLRCHVIAGGFSRIGFYPPRPQGRHKVHKACVLSEIFMFFVVRSPLQIPDKTTALTDKKRPLKDTYLQFVDKKFVLRVLLKC